MSTKFTLAAATLAAVTALAPLAAQGPSQDAKSKADNGKSAATGSWTPLFDGKSLAGWRGYKKADATETRWMVEIARAVDSGIGPRLSRFTL